MLDYKTSALIMKGLRDLMIKCEDIADYDSRKGIRKTVQKETRKFLLFQAQSKLLPNLREHLGDLFESLELDNLHRGSHPNLPHNALALISRLSQTVDQFADFVEEIIAIASIYSPHEFMKNDRDCGGSKACFILDWPPSREQLSSSADQSILTRRRESTITAINGLIDYSKRSDFFILQGHWQSRGDYLGGYLESLTRNVILPSRLKPAHIPHDEHTSTPIRSDDQPETIRNPGGTSQNTSPRFHVVQLAESIIAFIKLTRILSNKLSNTPSSKSPFTIERKICSYEMILLETKVINLYSGIQRIATGVQWLYMNAGWHASIDRIQNCFNQLINHFHSTVELLSFYLVPLNATVDLSPSDNFVKTWLFTLREQFHLASKICLSALDNLKKVM
ncbi:uncharacterized protein PGTG_17779 [Puccinia graminis f. sp. tritici CRL 75-36-700-3]|uniref:Uncharacterized protein n=1 Tax=Puccinia graminis f. sp. tritici (strain CRL 75-36-700-3 / race SCCL) TaxID=418459 RepID=E3L5F4_PUCGT|nr:uncharacterized protein PGTG_17779 [Puccinia graminis f. sp. tritici CRL 75-36-700-3]EFP91779.1 hypothetical protein PGTG_17779 [Puccinia graminis f. sp. tritici CRL 75-36-700-3]